MTGFRAGDFDRQVVVSVLRWFCPISAAHYVTDVDLVEMWKRGKRLLLLDVDNTLVEWRGEEFTAATTEWIALAKRLGFEICLVSNTKRVERLERLAEALDIPSMRGKFKPSRDMFRQALEFFGRRADEALMIGDQLFTDVFGANRSGIEAVWVRRLATREFPGTKVSRMGERVVRKGLYKAMTEADALETNTGPTGFLQRPVVRQFVKFCIIGGSSFVIDYCIRMTLQFAVPGAGGELMSVEVGRQLQQSMPWLFGFAETPKDAFFPIAATAGASVAILNSFIWNRLWTFRIRGKEERGTQFAKFVGVSLVGLALNVVLSTVFNHLIPLDPKNSARLATVLAAGCVAIWNFSGQKLYAFRRKPA